MREKPFCSNTFNYSLCNKFLVEFVCCHSSFWGFLWCKELCHRTESDLFLFALYLKMGSYAHASCLTNNFV